MLVITGRREEGIGPMSHLRSGDSCMIFETSSDRKSPERLKVKRNRKIWFMSLSRSMIK
jgi:hypothetical protein